MRVLLLGLLLAVPASAAERAFAFTWDTASLGAGQKELQLWLSPRLERAEESYTRFDLRAGLAHGVFDRLESLLTLDLDLESFGVDSRHVAARAAWQLRYRALPASAPVGVGFFSSLGLGFDGLAFEGRLVLDKQLGPVLLAANLGAVRSVAFDARLAPDLLAEGALAVRYELANRFAVGLEGLARTTWDAGAFQGTGVYLGPSFTWVGRRAWVTVALTAQVAADKAPSDVGNGEPLTLRDQERFAGRLLLGFATP